MRTRRQATLTSIRNAIWCQPELAMFCTHLSHSSIERHYAAVRPSRSTHEVHSESGESGIRVYEYSACSRNQCRLWGPA